LFVIISIIISFIIIVITIHNDVITISVFLIIKNVIILNTFAK